MSDIVKPTKQPVVTVPHNSTDVISPIDNVDELQEWKAWINENSGNVLAAKLRFIPSPVTKPISLNELLDCFGLSLEPGNEDVKSHLAKMKSTFSEWVKTFNFSYLAIANVAGKINTTPSFAEDLNALANMIEIRETGDKFRSLLSV